MMRMSDAERVERLVAVGISEVRAIVFMDMIRKLTQRRVTIDHAIAALEEAGFPVPQAHALLEVFKIISAEHGIVLRDEPPYPIGEAPQRITQVST